jgi:16S rRNA (guanine966-N2)-methyltransferase
VRVIGGELRGRRLQAPATAATRPTGDRVREAVFDVLGSMGDLDGLTVLDLFAGSGAMGIEALSRRAGRAVFVDRDPAALAAVRANLAALGLEDRATVVRADALGWLAGGGARAGGGAGPVPFDLALVDPPYRFGGWARLLEVLDARLAVLESSRPVAPGGRWETLRSKRYGGTLVTVVRRAPSAPDGPSAAQSPPDGTAETPQEKGTA